MSVPHNEHVIHLAREKRESFGNFKTFHDDLVDIGVILMEMVNLGKEEDYKK